METEVPGGADKLSPFLAAMTVRSSFGLPDLPAPNRVLGTPLDSGRENESGPVSGEPEFLDLEMRIDGGEYWSGGGTPTRELATQARVSVKRGPDSVDGEAVAVKPAERSGATRPPKI